MIMKPERQLPPARLTELIAALGAAAVQTDPAIRARYAQDLFWEGEAPLAVLRPATPEGVLEALRWSTRAGVAVLPRGGGVSYTAGYLLAGRPAVLLDLRDLDRIREVDIGRGVVVAEAGVTWSQLAEALAPHGLRTPYWGPLSGLRATLGGTLSQNSVFYGSGQHGSAAESVLGLEVATASGEVLRTGLAGGGFAHSRWGGPDLAGLFLGDNGALGVKLAVALRLIERPAVTEYASFAFDTLAAMVAAQITLARRGLGSEVFGIDAYKARNSAQTGKKLAQSAQTALGVVKNSGGVLQGLRNVARMALSGTEALEAAAYSLHIALEDRDAARAGAALGEVKEVCRAAKGSELEALVPRAMHARPFPPLRSVLGGRGQRWVPVHGILALADASAAITAIEAHIRSRQDALLAAGIEYSPLIVNVTHGILFEPCFYWFDALTPLHAEAYGEGLDPSWRQRPDAPETRRLVATLWEEVAAIFTRFGATHFQLGRRYACRERLAPAAAALLTAVKRELDPQGLLNPGALGL